MNSWTSASSATEAQIALTGATTCGNGPRHDLEQNLVEPGAIVNRRFRFENRSPGIQNAFFTNVDLMFVDTFR
jgi:hypothetical protein